METINPTKSPNIPGAIQMPPRTAYDDDITMIYKWAGLLQSPIKYLFLIPETDPKIYNSLIQFFRVEAGKNKSIKEIHQSLKETLDLGPGDRLPWSNIDIISSYALNAPGTTQQDRLRIFTEINDFLVAEGSPKLDDLQKLQTQVGNWKEQYNNSFQPIIIEIGKIRKREMFLDSQVDIALVSSDISVVRITILIKPKLRTASGLKVVTPEDGIDIFNYATSNKYVPYIKYNQLLDVADIEQLKFRDSIPGIKTPEGTPYFRSLIKLYKDSESSVIAESQRNRDNLQVNYDTVIIPSSQAKNIETIYFNLWSGDGKFSNITNDSIHKGAYDLDNNIIEIKSPVRKNYGKMNTLERIKRTFPIDINPEDTLDNEIKGEFYLYGSIVNNKLVGFEYDEPTLLYSILNMPNFNSYLYVDEKLSGYPNRIKIYIYFKSPSKIIDGNTLLETSGMEEDRLFGVSEGEFKENIGGKRLNAKYQVSISLDQLYANGGEIVSTQKFGDEHPKQITLKEKHPYIKVTVTKANSMEDIKRFFIIFNLLMTDYNNKRLGILNVIKFYIPESESLLKPVGKPEEDQKKITIKIVGTDEQTVEQLLERGATNIEELKQIAPDLFITDFARKGAQLKNRAIIPPLSQIEAIKQQTFEFKGKVYNRQVMEYPPANPFGIRRGPDNPRKRVLNFVCPDLTKYPFPGVKENKNLPNKDEYPYVPSCYGTDQMNPKANNRYNWYYHGRKMIASTKPKATLKSNKILDPGRDAVIYEEITSIIKNYPNFGPIEERTPSREQGNFFRRGVIRSPNSFIHCILDALNNPEYLGLRTNEEKEKLVQRYRLRLGGFTQGQLQVGNESRIYLDLFKQELYDQNQKEIVTKLNDISTFFDPALWYRGLEELFNINIYVFKKTQRRAKAGFTIELEMPRCRWFHVRNNIERPTIVILKHWGSESSKIEYPQCEIIYQKLALIISPLITPIAGQVVPGLTGPITGRFPTPITYQPLALLPHLIDDQMTKNVEETKLMTVMEETGVNMDIARRSLQLTGGDLDQAIRKANELRTQTTQPQKTLVLNIQPRATTSQPVATKTLQLGLLPTLPILPNIPLFTGTPIQIPTTPSPLITPITAQPTPITGPTDIKVFPSSMGKLLYKSMFDLNQIFNAQITDVKVTPLKETMAIIPSGSPLDNAGPTATTTQKTFKIQAQIPITGLKDVIPQLDVRKNFYTQINLDLLLKGSAIGQIIDQYGKLRGLYFPADLIKKAEPGNIDQPGIVLIFVPPSQPLNLPSYIKEIRSPLRTAVDILGHQITAVTRKDEIVNGLWYSFIDEPYGIYLPINPVTSKGWENIPDGPGNPIFGFLGDLRILNKESKTYRVRLLNKTLNVILQLIQWIFSVYVNDRITTEGFQIISEEAVLPQPEQITPIQQPTIVQPGIIPIQFAFPPLMNIQGLQTTIIPPTQVQQPVPVELETPVISVNTLIKEFVETFFVSGPVTTADVDSLDIYDISNIKRKIPSFTKPDEVIKYILGIIPSMIRNNKIYLYTPRFYEGMIYFLKNYINTTKTTNNGGYNQPIKIGGLYSYKEDFRMPKNNLLFISEHEFLKWLSDEREKRTKLVVHFKVLPEFRQLISPYFYRDQERIYLIQNVVNGSFDRALMNAYSWYEEKNNLGFKAPFFSGNTPAYVVYKVSADQKLVAQKDESLGTTKYLQLVDYGYNNYAAMLPMN